MITKHCILELLDYVKDPEVPAINVLEPGVVRSVELRHLFCGWPMDESLINRRDP